MGDEKDSSTWLMNLWQEKDNLKTAVLAEDWDTLATLGSFTPREQVTARLRPLLWTLLVNVLVVGFLVYWIGQGGTYIWMMSLLGVGGAWGALHLMVGVSKIKEA